MDELKPQAQRLYRSRRERMIAGVCGGLAQYFNVDPVIVRVAFVALGLATGVGLLAYIVLALVVPERPNDELEPVGSASSVHGGAEVLAYILVFVGAMALINNLGVFRLLSSFAGDIFWPFVLIGIGALLLARRTHD
jgi:phage shock protein C